MSRHATWGRKLRDETQNGCEGGLPNPWLVYNIPYVRRSVLYSVQLDHERPILFRVQNSPCACVTPVLTAACVTGSVTLVHSRASCLTFSCVILSGRQGSSVNC